MYIYKKKISGAAKRRCENPSVNEPKVFWKHAKRINSKSSGNNSKTILANKWVEHFSILSKKDPSELYPDNPNVLKIKEYINNHINEPPVSSILDRDFNISEIWMVLKN